MTFIQTLFCLELTCFKTSFMHFTILVEWKMLWLNVKKKSLYMIYIYLYDWLSMLWHCHITTSEYQIRDAWIVDMAGFRILDNPASNIRQILDQIRILNSTVFRNHVSGQVPWLTCLQRWTMIVTSDRDWIRHEFCSQTSFSVI